MHASSPARLLLLGYTLFSSTLALAILDAASIDSPRSYSMKLRRGRSSATAPVTYQSNGGRWYTDFMVGDQKLTLEVDTGSADL